MSGLRPSRGWIGIVFLGVLIPQLALVSAIATDIPIYDQWNVEGQWLYPEWLDGTLSAMDLLRPLNEHRIVWTHLLNLGLLGINGQWDPLLQLIAIALLRSACVAGIAAVALAGVSTRMARAIVALVICVAFLPHLAWHAVIWGIESQVYFALGFSLLALVILCRREPTSTTMIVGIAAGAAGMLAMGPAALVPVALLALGVLRALEARRVAVAWSLVVPGSLLLLLAVVLRVEASQHAELRASPMQFVTAALKLLAWPHVDAPLAALVVNAPITAVVVLRLIRRRVAVAAEDGVLAIGGWSAAIALATAWMRGGSPELQAGVPSRYVDFLVLLPLANITCLSILVREVVAGRRLLRLGAFVWSAFVLIGWLGLSSETMRRLIIPRARDREAPVRLTREFQLTGNAEVFAGQPRLLVPHPNPESVRAVLEDARLRGRLPPSLQPEAPVAPVSHGVRVLLGHQ